MTDTAIPARFPATPNDLATSLARASCHMDLGARLTFEGHLDADRLRRAVRLALDAEPILACSFETGWYSGHWQRRDDLDVCLPFSVLETDDPEAGARRFRAEPIADTGPQVAVLLLRSKDHDEVCVKISHVVADGQATKQYLYLLADLYTRLASDESYVPSPNLTPRPDGMDAWKGLTPEQRRAAKKMGPPLMPNWDIPCTALTGGYQTARELPLAPERFHALKGYGKARGATVNDMLLTAFFRALTRCFPPQSGTTMSFTSTADHRRYLRSTDGLPITNLSISGFLAMENIEGEDFDDTLARAVACQNAWKETCYGIVGEKQAASFAKIGLTGMTLAFKLMGRMGAGKSLPLFTNMGVIDEGRLQFDGEAPIAAHMLGPAAFGGSLVPTISTYSETLTVSIGFCADDIDAETVEGVLRAMDAELDRA